MFSKILKAATPKGDAVFTEVNGVLTNAPIHDEIMAGVDDTKLRQTSYQTAKDAGVGPEGLALLA